MMPTGLEPAPWNVMTATCQNHDWRSVILLFAIFTTGPFELEAANELNYTFLAQVRTERELFPCISTSLHFDPIAQ